MPISVSTLLDVNFNGPSGATGATGAIGATGVVGVSGLIGPSGRSGATGAASPSFSGQMVLLGSAGWPSFSSGANFAALNIGYNNGMSFQSANFLTESVQTTTRYHNWSVAMPDDYNGGTVTARFYWVSESALTSGVVWGLSGRSFGDSEVLNAGLGTVRTVFDANNAANRVNISSGTAPITLAGTPARNEYVHFRAERQAGAANDGLTSNARLLAVVVNYARLRGSGTTITPVKWANIIGTNDGNNSAVVIEGIDEPIILQVNYASTDSTTLAYIRNAVDVPISSGGTINVVNNDTLYFFTVPPETIPIGTVSSGSVFIINLSDENTLIDDFTWEITYPL